MLDNGEVHNKEYGYNRAILTPGPHGTALAASPVGHVSRAVAAKVTEPPIIRGHLLRTGCRAGVAGRRADRVKQRTGRAGPL